MLLRMAIIVAIMLVLSRMVVDAHSSNVLAIFVFGDSTADVGNNNHLSSLSTRANFPYNGIDYPNKIPTGRFCNGYNGVDFLAKMMGFKESPPAYFSITDEAQESRGVNFASGGSGVFDTTGQNVSFSMNTQITFFKEIAGHLIRRKGDERARLLLSKSIFIFSTVNNDMFGFYTTFGPQNITQKEQFITHVTAQFKDQLKKIYELGARKFVVYGTGPVGCPPALRRLNPNGGCIDDLNELSQLFNKAMKVKLQSLTSNLAEMKYAFISSYNITNAILARPSHYGFKDLTNACCGSGTFNAATLCLPNATVCANRKEYLSWDYVHPTQAAYEVNANYAFHGSQHFAVPINVKELTQI